MTILRKLKKKQVDLSFRITCKKVNRYYNPLTRAPQDANHAINTGYIANVQSYNYFQMPDEITDYMTESLVASIVNAAYELYLLLIHGIILSSHTQWAFLRCCDNAAPITMDRAKDLIYDLHVTLLHIYRGEWEDFEQDLLEQIFATIKSYKFDRDKPILFRGYFYRSYPRRVATLINHKRRNCSAIFNNSLWTETAEAMEIEYIEEDELCPIEKTFQKWNVKYTK